MSDFPIVTKDDPGIRPATGPDKCFYCGCKVGEPHEQECVTIKKRVKVRYEYEVEINVPHFWTAEDLEFHHNEGSWCADNSIRDIEQYISETTCICNRFKAVYLHEVDATPKKEVKE